MKKNGLKLLSALTAFILLTGCGAYASGDLLETGDNFFISADPAYEKLAERVKKSSHSNSFNGSILLATDDKIILYGGPNALTREGRPVDIHTTYDIGSCSKTFTAVAVFQLIEAGLISPDDPVTRFFPEYEAGGGITVYHLLHMQSGIADYVNDPETFWGIADGQEYDRFMYRFFRDEVPDAEFLQALYAAPLYFAPGTDQSYSNTNYHILALIVEQVSGIGFDEYLREHIFDPCGLEHTTSMVAGNETSVPRVFGDLLAYGIVDENGYTMSPAGERGAGGIHTCAADLWAFDRALLSGLLVGSDSLEEMTHFDMDYGCGLYPFGKNGYGHTGRNGTYSSVNAVIESAQYGRIYFIASTATDAGAYGLDALTRLLGGI